MKPITENNIETFAIETLQSMGWEYVYGLQLAPGAERAERNSFEQIVLVERLRKSVSILNPDIPYEAQEQAIYGMECSSTHRTNRHRLHP